MVMLTLSDVGVTLGRRRVLSGIDAQFAPGSLIGIVGPNGAGKSTLARAMLALVPTEGRIESDGVAPAALPRRELAKRIAYLPQGQSLNSPTTVERVVELGRQPHPPPETHGAAPPRD